MSEYSDIDASVQRIFSGLESKIDAVLIERDAFCKRVEELERTVKLYKTALEANQEVIQAIQSGKEPK